MSVFQYQLPPVHNKNGLLIAYLHIHLQGDWKDTLEGHGKLMELDRKLRHKMVDKTLPELTSIVPGMGNSIHVDIPCLTHAEAEKARSALASFAKENKMIDATPTVAM